MNKPYTYKPVRFFLVTNLIMWSAWLAAAYLSYQPGGGPAKLISLLAFIGFLSPLVTALWLILASRNPELKQNFYRKLFDLGSIRPWTLPAIFLIVPASIIVSVALSHLFFKEPWDQLLLVKNAPWAAGIIPAQLLLILIPIIEEIGWKGYGMESLRGDRSFLKATLIFAALWAFWHGPTFFVNNYYQNMLIRTDLLYALNFVVSFFPATVIFNWLWYKNRGNILTAILCHLAIDFQGMLRMGQNAKCLETLVFFVIAALVVATNKKMFFGKFPAQIGYFGEK